MRRKRARPEDAELSSVSVIHGCACRPAEARSRSGWLLVWCGPGQPLLCGPLRWGKRWRWSVFSSASGVPCPVPRSGRLRRTPYRPGQGRREAGNRSKASTPCLPEFSAKRCGVVQWASALPSCLSVAKCWPGPLAPARLTSKPRRGLSPSWSSRVKPGQANPTQRGSLSFLCHHQISQIGILSLPPALACFVLCAGLYLRFGQIY
jgi:hypothetical protein